MKGLNSADEIVEPEPEVVYIYRIVRFNSKEERWFNELVRDGWVSGDFSDFVKGAYYDKINRIRGRHLKVRGFGKVLED